MGIFSNFFKNTSESIAKQLVNTTVKSSKILLGHNYKSNTAIFEILLLSSVHILRRYQELNNKHYKKFEEDFFLELHKFAEEKLILEKIPNSFTDFVNSRFELYDEQIHSIFNNNDHTFLPSKIAYNLYDNPLHFHSGHSTDLMALGIIMSNINEFFDSLNTSIDQKIKVNSTFEKRTNEPKKTIIEETDNVLKNYSDKIKQTINKLEDCDFQNINNINLVEEYINLTTYIIASSVLFYTMKKNGITEDTLSYKNVRKAVLDYSINFYKKYIFTNLIELSEFHTSIQNEDSWYIKIHLKISDYEKDLAHFFNTNEFSYEELLEYDEAHNYINRINYSFIKDTILTKITESENGIFIEYLYGSDEWVFEDDIIPTLKLIAKVKI